MRLAQKMGLLKGKHLSPIQVQAIEILDRLDQEREFTKASEEYTKQVKLALVANPIFVSDTSQLVHYFPEIDFIINNDPQEATEEDLERQDLTFIFQQDDLTLEDVSRVLGGAKHIGDTFDVSLDNDFVQDALNQQDDEIGWR